MPLPFYHQAYKEQRIVNAALDLALSDRKSQSVTLAQVVVGF